MREITYLHPVEEDVPAMTDVRNESKKESKTHKNISSDEFFTWTFNNTDFDPKRCLNVKFEGGIVGYCELLIEKSRKKAGLNDGTISMELIPRYRNLGIQEKLMEFMIDYANTNKIEKLTFNCNGLVGWKHDLSLKFNFIEFYHQYSMICNKREKIQTPSIPANINFVYRMLKDANYEEMKDFTHTSNDFYSDIFDFAPEILENWIWLRDNLNDDEDRITFAKMKGTTVGICWHNEIEKIKNGTTSREGYICSLGVIKPYRNQGIGRVLLIDGMNWLIERGISTITLNVDAINEDALKLYISSGFEIQDERIIYQLRL